MWNVAAVLLVLAIIVFAYRSMSGRGDGGRDDVEGGPGGGSPPDAPGRRL